VFGEDGRATGTGAAAHTGDDQKGVDLVGRDRVDGVLYLVDVLLGDFRAEFVVSTHAVALDAGLADEYAILLWYIIETDEVRLRGVDGNRRADDSATRPIVVIEESIDDFATGLSESDHRQLHCLFGGSVELVPVQWRI